MCLLSPPPLCESGWGSIISPSINSCSTRSRGAFPLGYPSQGDSGMLGTFLQLLPSFPQQLQPAPTIISQQTPPALQVPLPTPWQRGGGCSHHPIPAPKPAPVLATSSLSWAQHMLKDNFSSQEERRCLPPEPRCGHNLPMLRSFHISRDRHIPQGTGGSGGSR